MHLSETTKKFIRDHAGDKLPELLLSASRYPGVNVKEAVVQIKARNRIRDKLPSWYRDDRLYFPSTLAVEQCSSELTAMYKQRFVQVADWVCDLTGGLGVDSYFFAQKASRVTYVEREEAYCDAARNNFQFLKANPVEIIHADAIELVANSDERIAGVDVFYLDPDRRGTGNKRLFAISDCEPDLTKIISLLQKQCRLIVKLSPMLDITQALSQIPNVREVHIVSVKNDCKEVLIISGGLMQLTQTDPVIYCVNYTTDGTEQPFRFRLSEEYAADITFAKDNGRYLYEPNASILKAGAYKSIALQYNVAKLHASSHLYTSDRLITPFPGRIFEITEIIPFSSRICKSLYKNIPQAHVAVRNFPLSVAELRKRTKIADGGTVYLFATTLSDNRKALIQCRKHDK